MSGESVPGAVGARYQALARANEIRIERSRLLGGNPKTQGTRALLSTDRAVELILDPPEALMGATVSLLLLRVRRIGPSKTAALCKRIGVSEYRRIGDMSGRQRLELAALLEARR